MLKEKQNTTRQYITKKIYPAFVYIQVKKNYFKLEDAQYDAFSYKQFIYVCSPESKNRIYHLILRDAYLKKS